MSASSVIDLAHREDWFGLRPGISREEAAAILKRQGVEMEPFGENRFTAETDDWELDLFFGPEEAPRLRQIGLDAEELRWNKKPLLWIPLDRALAPLDPIGPAMWTKEDATDHPFAAEEEDAVPEEPPRAVSSEEVLERGTLWLAERRLGLVVYSGETVGLVWRDARDFPRRFAAPFTEEQREITKRADLGEYLSEKRIERIVAARPPDPRAPWRKLCTVLLCAALAALGWKGVQESKRWGQAETIQGKLVEVTPMVQKQFRDYVPGVARWIFPVRHPLIVDGYRVAYQDETGSAQQAVLERSEFYVPATVGEEVPLALAQHPTEVKGLFRARDAALIEGIPAVVGMAALYGLAMLAVALLPHAWRAFAPNPKGRLKGARAA